MAHQIIYTSVPRGIAPGSKGYCTVVASNGMAPALQRQLESLSQYHHIHPPNTPKDYLNPTNYQFSTARFGGKQLCVLSRVSDAGLDYSRRSNLLAHHVALEIDECATAGPAAVLERVVLPQNIKQWDQQPQKQDIVNIPNPTIPTSRMTSHISLGVSPELVGDIAQKLAHSKRQIVTVLYRQEHHSNLLALVTDIFWLLPSEMRWDVTFSTYYTADIQNTDIRLRFIPHGSPNAERAQQDPATIDLNQNMTVLDSEMVVAAVEAAKTGNRTLAHTQKPDPGRMASSGFTRSKPTSTGSRPPIGGTDFRLQPPPIANPVNQPINQDRHGISNSEIDDLPENHRGNQDRHGSTARNKLVFVISLVSIFLLLGIILLVVLDKTETVEVSNNQDRHEMGGGAGTQASQNNRAQDSSNTDQSNATGEMDGNSDSNQDRHGNGESENSGNQDRHGTVGQSDSESPEDPLKPTDFKTFFVVDMRKKEVQYENIERVLANQQAFTQFDEDINLLASVHEKRLVLLHTQNSNLVINQSSKSPQKITLGLKEPDHKDLLDIELTGDKKQELSWTLNSKLDDLPEQRNDLKKALSKALIETVLLIPYRLDGEKESGFDQKVRMRVLVFGGSALQLSPLSEFPNTADGYQEIGPEASTALVTALETAGRLGNSKLVVSANLPRYDLQKVHKQIDPIELPITKTKRDFEFENFWNFWGTPDLEKEKKEANYTPRINLQLTILDDGQAKFRFPVTEVSLEKVIDKKDTFDVFTYVDGLAASDYVWEPMHYKPEVAPPGEKPDQRRIREASNINKAEEEAKYHRRFAIELGRGFLQLKPTSAFHNQQVGISTAKLIEWDKQATSFQLKPRQGSMPSVIQNLKDLININGQIFAHLPDFSRLQGMRNANELFDGKFSLWIARDKDKSLTFGENYERNLSGYETLLSNQFNAGSLHPEKLESVISDLTNWAKTLHGLIRIRENMKQGVSVQLQLQVESTFELNSAVENTNDVIRMATDSKHDNKDDELVVPIFRLGTTPPNMN